MGKFPCSIWHNSNLVVLLFLWFIYFWGRKNQSALKLVLDFESPSKFWGFRITYRLPVGLSLLRKRPIKNIVQIDYPRVSPGAHPLAKKPEDSGYEIGACQSYCQSSWSAALAKRIAALGTRMTSVPFTNCRNTRKSAMHKAWTSENTVGSNCTDNCVWCKKVQLFPNFFAMSCYSISVVLRGEYSKQFLTGIVFTLCITRGKGNCSYCTRW